VRLRTWKDMRAKRRTCLSILALAIPAPASDVLAEAPLTVVVGVTESGEATPRWSEMLRHRMPPERYAAVSGQRRPLTPSEQAWVALIRSRVSRWEDERPGLARPYAPVPPPGTATIVVGNQAAPGDDAFTHDAATIGFDLGELQSAYGDAGRPENTDRIDRFYRHEYAHLMQRAWLAVHPWPPGPPLTEALLEIWKEGLGNYHSLSARWRTESGEVSPIAQEALAALEPRFAARLAALACARPDRSATLTSDLSRGPFDRKWGALPVALWLATEPGEAQQALRAFVQAGPGGVWDLAARRLPRPLSAVLGEARQSAARCAGAASFREGTLPSATAGVDPGGVKPRGCDRRPWPRRARGRPRARVRSARPPRPKGTWPRRC
jgi:hypothetical protein